MAFLGATGATPEQGLSTLNLIEAATKAAMVASAAACSALVDYSKLGRASLASFVSWADLDYLVTDAPLPPTFYDLLARDNNVACLVAKGT